MQNKFKDKVRVQHILDSIVKINEYTNNLNFEEFKDNTMAQDACVRQLGIIGEACNHLSTGTKEISNTIQWRQIIGLRNIVIHEYFGIDEQVIWNVIKYELPLLEEEIIALQKQL